MNTAVKYLRCTIIEDNDIDRMLLEDYLSKYRFISIAGSFANPVESLEHLKRGNTDLLFCDVDMPGMTGIELLRSFPNAPPCIFTTVHSEYAVDAFDTQAIDYILKPIAASRLDTAIQRAVELLEIRARALQFSMQIETDSLMIKEGTTVNRVNVNDIIYLEALANYTKVVTEKKRYITLKNLKTFLDDLPVDRFLRIHRSYAVAIDKILSLDKNDLLLNQARLPIGKIYRREIKNAIKQRS
jgi:DNA-binding LytR/AlgR family response regulator